jgi:hypothetical protein
MTAVDRLNPNTDADAISRGGDGSMNITDYELTDEATNEAMGRKDVCVGVRM